jgi:hypothetical protein
LERTTSHDDDPPGSQRGQTQQEGSVPAKPHLDPNDVTAAGSWERYLRGQLVNLAERIATVEDVRAQVCERLAGDSGTAATYWRTEARHARWVARVERQIADGYRHDSIRASGSDQAAGEVHPVR